MSKYFIAIVACVVFMNVVLCHALENPEYPKVKTQSVKTSGVKYIVSKTIVKTTMSNIMNMMNDPASYTEWLHYCIEAKLLKKISESQGVFLFIYDTDSFWYKNRYLIANAVFQHDSALNKMKYHISEIDESELMNEYRPGNAVKVKSFDIYWTFTCVDNKEILVEYKLSIDPGIPFGVSGYLKRMSRATLEKFGKIVNSEKYSK